MNLSYRPLPVIWPSGERTDSWARKNSPFKAGWTNTLQLLERELRHLGVSWDDTVLVEAGYAPSEIRLDGQPRANAHPTDPAVILSFQSTWGPLRYGCDTFTSHQANVRAIALGLEALRAVDRYGVTKRGEQYAGWKSLPAPGAAESSTQHRDFLLRHAYGMTLTAGVPPDTPTLSRAYRLAAQRLHPDKGGSREDWDQLQRAKAALGL